MQLLGLQMCLTAKHLAVSASANQRHLLDRETGLEEAARAFVLKMRVLLDFSMVGIELGTPATLGEFLVSKSLDRE